MGSAIIEIEDKREITIPKIDGNNFKLMFSKTKINLLKFEKKNITDKSIKIQLSFKNQFLIYYSEYNSKKEIYENGDDIDKKVNKKNYINKICRKYKYNNLNTSSIGIILYLIYNNNSNLRLHDKNINEKQNEYISI